VQGIIDQVDEGASSALGPWRGVEMPKALPGDEATPGRAPAGPPAMSPKVMLASKTDMPVAKMEPATIHGNRPTESMKQGAGVGRMAPDAMVPPQTPTKRPSRKPMLGSPENATSAGRTSLVRPHVFALPKQDVVTGIETRGVDKSAAGRVGFVIGGDGAIVSWGPNRIDTFVVGTDHAMYHKWWD
jgi:hypothetical protein